MIGAFITLILLAVLSFNGCETPQASEITQRTLQAEVDEWADLEAALSKSYGREVEIYDCILVNEKFIECSWNKSNWYGNFVCMVGYQNCIWKEPSDPGS